MVYLFNFLLLLLFLL